MPRAAKNAMEVFRNLLSLLQEIGATRNKTMAQAKSVAFVGLHLVDLGILRQRWRQSTPVDFVDRQI
jgi:hypothetical protein